MAQVVIVWVRSQVSPCEICCGQSGTGTAISSSTLVFPCKCHFHNAPFSCFICLPVALHKLSSWQHL